VACKLIAAGTHPDLRLVQIGQEDTEEAAAAQDDAPLSQKKPNRQISVDRIRALNELVANTAYRGRAKVILISPAEAMHPSASNALLKILEEPPQGTHFLLVSHSADRLLPTIRSRCFHVGFPVPPATESMRWLEEQGLGRAPLALAQSSYAPLAARERDSDALFWEQRKVLLDVCADPDFDPLVAADGAEALDSPVVARLMLQWAYDLLALISGSELRYHLDYRVALSRLAGKLQPDLVIGWHDAVLQYARSSHHPLNKRLALEDLFSVYPAHKAKQ
jgi:DNA polymerase III subunit delta'